MANFGWNYPPGVTGSEPQITGEWPCLECQGECYWPEHDGGGTYCPRCNGSGIEPEDLETDYIQDLIDCECRDKEVLEATLNYCESYHKEFVEPLRELLADA